MTGFAHDEEAKALLCYPHRHLGGCSASVLAELYEQVRLKERFFQGF